MSEDGCDTPESAAMVGFPPKYCRVIASRFHGDHAYVLLNAGSSEQPYLYGVNCRRAARTDDGSREDPRTGRAGNEPATIPTDSGLSIILSKAS
jgi:hypothetical protein